MPPLAQRYAPRDLAVTMLRQRQPGGDVLAEDRLGLRRHRPGSLTDRYDDDPLDLHQRS